MQIADSRCALGRIILIRPISPRAVSVNLWLYQVRSKVCRGRVVTSAFTGREFQGSKLIDGFDVWSAGRSINKSSNDVSLNQQVHDTLTYPPWDTVDSAWCIMIWALLLLSIGWGGVLQCSGGEWFIRKTSHRRVLWGCHINQSLLLCTSVDVQI